MRQVIGRVAPHRLTLLLDQITLADPAVFSVCVEFGKGVEINSRPERLAPPKGLLRQAVEMRCEFAVDTDTHAPGQLDWQGNGS